MVLILSNYSITIYVRHSCVHPNLYGYYLVLKDEQILFKFHQGRQFHRLVCNHRQSGHQDHH